MWRVVNVIKIKLSGYVVFLKLEDIFIIVNFLKFNWILIDLMFLKFFLFEKKKWDFFVFSNCVEFIKGRNFFFFFIWRCCCFKGKVNIMRYILFLFGRKNFLWIKRLLEWKYMIVFFLIIYVSDIVFLLILMNLKMYKYFN